MKLTAGLSWFRTLLQACPLCVGLLLGLPAARAADDLPADTNAITSLTPAQAAKLAAEFPGVKGKAQDEAEDFEFEACLPLNGLKSLDAETARALAKFGNEAILLDGLTTLSPETAAALGTCTCEVLSLTGLTTLSPEAAKGLAAFGGNGLYLNGLTTLSPESAAVLATFKGGGLSLNGLTTLSSESAAILATFKGYCLSLEGLADLTPETAKALAEFSGHGMFLGSTTVSPETAAALAAFKGSTLKFVSMTDLPPESARALAGFAGKWLELGGLKTLPVESVVALGKSKVEYLYLDDLKQLTPEGAAALASGGRCLSLDSLEQLPPDVAAKFVEFPGQLYCRPLYEMRDRTAAEATTLTTTDATLLACGSPVAGFIRVPGVTAFDTPDSVEIAEILARAKQVIVFPNLKCISPRTFAKLVENGNVLLPDMKTVEIIPEPDGSNSAVADDFVLPDGFAAPQERMRKELELSR